MFDNQLSGPLPSCLGRLSNVISVRAIVISFEQVKILDIHNNPMMGPLPEGVSNWTLCTEINIDNCRLSGPLPSKLGNLRSLTSFSFANIQFSGPIPENIGGLAQLTSFNLGNLSEKGREVIFS